jgi:hypothetical protein
MKDYIQEHELLRRQLWIDFAYRGDRFDIDGGCQQADKMLAEFDKRFKQLDRTRNEVKNHEKIR